MSEDVHITTSVSLTPQAKMRLKWIAIITNSTASSVMERLIDEAWAREKMADSVPEHPKSAKVTETVNEYLDRVAGKWQKMKRGRVPKTPS